MNEDRDYSQQAVNSVAIHTIGLASVHEDYIVCAVNHLYYLYSPFRRLDSQVDVAIELTKQFIWIIAEIVLEVARLNNFCDHLDVCGGLVIDLVSPVFESARYQTANLYLPLVDVVIVKAFDYVSTALAFVDVGS